MRVRSKNSTQIISVLGGCVYVHVFCFTLIHTEPTVQSFGARFCIEYAAETVADLLCV